MVLRSFYFASIKTTRFYLLQNQSSAAGAQPAAAFWCNPLTETYAIPPVFARFRTFMKVKIDFLCTRPQFFQCGNPGRKQK
jgi:hypothetical protein